MNIGIVSPFNPQSVSEYLDNSIPQESNISCSAPSVETYVIGLLRDGHYVRIFTLHSGRKSILHFYGKQIDIYSIKSGDSFCFFKPLFNIWKSSISLKKLIKKHIKGLDVLHAQWTYEYAFATITFTHQLPVFCTVRDWAPYVWSTIKGWFRNYRLLWISKIIMWRKVINNESIHFIANSEYTQKCLMSTKKGDIPIIYNPIDTQFIKKERDKYPDHPILISVSVNLSERKNYNTLIKAFSQLLKRHPDAELLLCGAPFNKNNPQIKEWQNLELLNHVHLIGKVNHEQLFNYYDQATLLVHPSIEETFGNTLIEAMARRIPCIGGEKAGAVPFVLDHGKCGLLCDVTNPDSICNTINRIIEEKELYNSLVNIGTEQLLEKYADNVIVKRHIEYYKTFK